MEKRITAKATNTRLFLQRNLTFFDSETRLMCYKTYVRPIVEYASSVWDPVGNNTLVEKIESIQRKSLRWIHNIWESTVSPTALRKVLEISTLESRRSSARLKWCLTFYTKTNILTPTVSRVDNVVWMWSLSQYSVLSRLMKTRFSPSYQDVE